MNNIRYLIMGMAILAADQLTKWVALTYVMAQSPIAVLPFFNLVLVWNKGVSFGLFNQDSDYGPLLLSALSLIITIAFIIWFLKSQSTLQKIGITLVICGALGNIIDRLRFGAVVDFLDFHAFGTHWPAFNVADSAICVGVFLLIIYGLFFEKA